MLPQLSVAIHVLTIFAEPAQPSAPVSEVSVKEISTSLSQLSVAVIPAALPFPVSSSQLAVMSAGTPENTGGVLSSTVIIC